LHKFYGSFCAVKNLTFGVEDDECFGLLGANGAGKTTTFRVVTGEALCNFGKVVINGQPAGNVKAIGFCPQFDALLEDLTGRETLRQRRRLSVGLAVISQARVMLLDEPTAGIDPKTRRQIWDLLSAMRDKNCAMVLTSHSMEECEALCTRIGILLKGSFIALGTPQHLKSKYVFSLLPHVYLDLDEGIHLALHLKM
uniref:ABC transporter domain-containing protein n=1 Tax=Enterobius vermicularis TaxID=51028 RepID=A0A0N4V0A2_ENTVE